MPVIEKETRIVRAYASDLAVGDILMDPYGAYIGTVESSPEITADNRYVTAMVYRERDGQTVERRWRAETVMRVEMARRVR